MSNSEYFGELKFEYEYLLKQKNMPNIFTLTSGLASPGIQLSDWTDLHIVMHNGYTERWNVDLTKIVVGMSIQIAANNLRGYQPRGWVINSTVTGIQLLPPINGEIRRRFRIYFDTNPNNVVMYDTGIAGITLNQNQVRYF